MVTIVQQCHFNDVYGLITVYELNGYYSMGQNCYLNVYRMQQTIYIQGNYGATIKFECSQLYNNII